MFVSTVMNSFGIHTYMHTYFVFIRTLQTLHGTNSPEEFSFEEALVLQLSWFWRTESGHHVVAVPSPTAPRVRAGEGESQERSSPTPRAGSSLPRRPPDTQLTFPPAQLIFSWPLPSISHFSASVACKPLWTCALRHPTEPVGAQGHRAGPLPVQWRGVLTILFFSRLCKWYKLPCHDHKDALCKLCILKIVSKYKEFSGTKQLIPYILF